MNRLVFINLLFGIFMLNSCMASCMQPVVRGNGKLVTETRDPGDFSGVSLSVSAELFISKGEECSVVIEAEENLMPYLETDVRNGRLTVRSNANITTREDIRIYVTTSDIEVLRTTGSGNINVLDRFSADRLNLEVLGSGNISVEISAREITSSIRGSGDIKLAGRCREHNISIMGSGDMRSDELESGVCKVSVMGSGNAYVWVNSLLDINIMGSGNVYYKGSPDISTRQMGSGRVRKL